VFLSFLFRWSHAWELFVKSQAGLPEGRLSAMRVIEVLKLLVHKPGTRLVGQQRTERGSNPVPTSLFSFM
jgi:hypothetical protein